VSTRVDLSPEPTHVLEAVYNFDTMRDEVEVSPVPAAGWLGVHEVVCPEDHEKILEIHFSCPTCRAAY
jgi:hypothetical protein